jgi:hypothetical protein
VDDTPALHAGFAGVTRPGAAMTRTALAIIPALCVAACGGGAASPGASSPVREGAPAALRAAAPSGPVVVDEAPVRGVIRAGKQVVLLFMATGCSSCAAQASALVAGAAGHAVQLVGVDVSAADDRSTLRTFLHDAGLESLDQSLDQRYQVQALDETAGLAGGTVRFHNPSSVDAGRLHQQIGGLT